jgi:uncharacterized protein (DUF952 family)
MELFKILAADLWAEAQAQQRVPWAPVDEADGFVHLSTPQQVRETADRHFATAANLVLVRIDGARLEHLRWEPSRGGALFPHVFGDIPLHAVTAVTTLVGARPGEPSWPDDVP